MFHNDSQQNLGVSEISLLFKILIVDIEIFESLYVKISRLLFGTAGIESNDQSLKLSSFRILYLSRIFEPLMKTSPQYSKNYSGRVLDVFSTWAATDCDRSAYWMNGSNKCLISLK